MRLFYRICERPIKRLKTTHPQTIESKSGSGSSLNNTNSNLSNSNNANNNSVSQSKLVASQASTSTSNTSTLTTIMTGAATLPALPTLNSTKTSNNSGATGVTSSKGSNTTPKNADTITSSTVNAYRVTSSPTAATPQGIFKSTHMSPSAVQTDEPPKKLRKILPANNSSATTPKAVPITNINCSTSTPTTLSPTTTSSSTVNSLRQCRINTDKNKSLCSTVNTNSNVGLSACKPSAKEETKCVNSAITITSLGSSVTSAKRNSSRKSSAFDVRTLIGTKSPTLPSLPSQRQSVESAISGNECKDEIGINHKNSAKTTNIGGTAAAKPSKGNSNMSLSSSVRELNRNTVTSSMCSMPSSLSSITTGSSGNKKPLSNSSSVAISRPPTNRSTSPKVVATLRPFVPLKITKSGTFVSPKQLNAKSLKASQNDISVKTCNTTRDVKSDNINNKISNKPITKDVPQIQPNKPQRQSNPLSPPSIRIKLPPPPTTTSPSKPSIPNVSVHNNSKNISNAKEQTQQSKQTESSRQQDLNKSSKDLPESDTKIGLTQQKSVQHIKNQSHSKSSISQTSLTKTKGAAINQIVSKIASAVTAKSTSVNVTSTTPTLELSKTNTSTTPTLELSKTNISGAVGSGLGSTKVSANEVNDDKVSTTTNESGVSSSIHKDESAIKALTSATNTGNLVIRISTKSQCFTSLKDKDRNSIQKPNKFQIKRDLNFSNISPTDNNTTQCLNGKNDNNHKSETELKSVNLFKSNNNLNNDLNNDDEDDDDDDNSIDGRKLVVDVPNEDSCENEVGTSKVTLEMDDIDSGRGSDIIRLSCDDIEMGSPQSTTLSIKTPESLSASSDISTKLAINITSTTTLSANSAVLASPPPTPSPKSESDPCITVVTKSNKSSSSSPNGPLDLSMWSTNKKDSHQKMVTPPAIYDIPAPKPKHCVNPAVLDKHRGLFPPSNAPNKQHPSFKIIPTPSHSSRQSNPPQQPFLPSTNFNSSKKDRSINSSMITSNPTTGSSSSNQSRNRSQVSHHHQHHHHHKNYSVITPDPHRYTPKLVIKNISSPPSITSHFNYPTHH